MIQPQIVMLPAGGTAVRMGLHVIPVAGISGRHLVPCAARDVKGQFLNAGLYLAVAAVILIGVADLAWHSRFLIAVVFFACVGAMAFSDVVTTRPITYYELVVTTRDGVNYRISTPDVALMERFDAAVAGAGGFVPNRA